jgi:hypothetical protein
MTIKGWATGQIQGRPSVPETLIPANWAQGQAPGER